MEQTLYTCDRCGAEAKQDRSRWEYIFHSHQLHRDKTLLCPLCFEYFVKFLRNAD